MNGDGLSIRSIASRMNMSVETARRLLNGKFSAFERARDESAIGRLRKKWLKTRSKSVYDKLYYLDRAWLTTVGKSGWCGSRGPKKDWPALDKTYAPRLRSAIAKLRSQSRRKGISYLALERECGIKNLKLKAAKMPRCSRILFNASVGRKGGVPPQRKMTN
ncbi:TnsD family Tn7-like transposition protein [Bradyrhizobium zhanjiangense]|uniref:TnsD family Tn7-like transposition protein n=1 Tax=Bradyrhizobium zhanjiangense TaxID=1325107 RepID=UPI003D31A096